ncbi:MAG: hypothetical protein LBO00_05960 [Zoogloeaceae bacterium]|jgi:Tfp pilus assembly protein PilX|nr:hypothetical protein [Zoogloeaceae bacterium]
MNARTRNFGAGGFVRREQRGLWHGRRILRRGQRGAALAVGLVMLVVVTLLSLAAMQTVRLQERMAGNQLSRAQVYEDALGGARHAESCLLHRLDCANDLVADIETTDTANGFYRVSEGDAATQQVGDLNDPATWEGHSEQQPSAGELVLGIHPWRIVERLPNALVGASVSVQQRRTLQVFRINVLAADSEPETAESISIVQSTLTRE